MKNLQYLIYILTSKKLGTLYIGVTNNLIKRVWEHKNDLEESFTNWKINLIEKHNPDWSDLYPNLLNNLHHGSPHPRG